MKLSNLFCRLLSTKKQIPIHASDQVIDTTRLHLINQRLHQELGPIYMNKIGPDVNAVWIACPKMTELVFRNEPDHPIHVVPQCWQVFNEKYKLKRGLFFLDGLEWHQMRRKMNPIFLKSVGLESALEHSKRVTDRLILSLEKRVSEAPTDLDMEPILHEWSVESTLSTLYGTSFDEPKEDINHFIQNVHQMFAASATLQTQSAEQACQESSQDWQDFDSSATSMMKYLQRNFNTGKAQENDGLTSHLAQVFENEQVQRIANDLLIAAADTTSITTLWALYLMTINEPQIDIPAKYAIKESMRLFPVAPFLTRIQQKPLSLGNYQLQPGQLILISIYAMARNSNYFKNPEAFLPNRWIRNKGGINHSFASLPFGFGVRSCIGKRLAENQMEYLIQKLFGRFKISVLNEKPVGMKMKMIGIPDTKILFRLQRKEVNCFIFSCPF